MYVETATVETAATRVLEALGTPESTATIVAQSLTRSDARTGGTHGVGLLPLYAAMIEDGAIEAAATPSVQRDGSTACVDGHDAFGQVVGREATAVGVDAALESGVSVVGVRNGCHLGRLGEWAERAADHGLCSIIFSNTGGGAKNVAPYGGHSRALSTNPVAFGVPTFGAADFDIVVDFATSQVSGSVIRDAARTGVDLKAAWTTTEDGTPVDSAGAFLEGDGALLPLGGRETGHKGYGLAVIAEALGAMAGGSVVGETEPDWFSNAATFVFVDPTRFGPRVEFERRLEAVITHLHESDDDVRLPGEGATRRGRQAQEKGVHLEVHIRDALTSLATDLGVELPGPLAKHQSDVSTGDGDGDDQDDVRTW
ncbi:Ldh family oxidoreductase [Natronosalvus amylolyticus]|uniref:Ldh family oxidoreductase n=1 Tax=Natronosalvus amylolyticus TaxID=2961994 RepID=UPI0020C99C5B|nr:Ldh family oxidoreductase [Natronosalvus amylolyticus]